ncbi:MAG: PPOX class F420-dependent oxidoreductase [Chloroflexales bacterium]
MTGTTTFAGLRDQQYISLTTYRKSGEAIATPVWFALDGERMYIVTPADSGKVKRIRNNGRVSLAPSDGRGKLKGPAMSALAALTDQAEGGAGDRALKAKYGWMYGAFNILWRFRKIKAVFLEVRPA